MVHFSYLICDTEGYQIYHVGNEIKVATKVNLRDSDGNHGQD